MPVKSFKVGQRVRFNDNARYVTHLCGPGRTYEYGTVRSKGRFRRYENHAGRVRYEVTPETDPNRRFYFALDHLDPADNKFDLIIAKKFPDVDAAIAAATTIAAKIKLPISVRAT